MLARTSFGIQSQGQDLAFITKAKAKDFTFEATALRTHQDQF